MAEVIWSKRAAQQFERALKFIKEEQGLVYAEIVRQKILSNTKLLETQPELGFVEPLLKHKKTIYRTIVVWSYKIIYKQDKRKVTISRLFHTSRSPGKLRGV